ncbi:MAG: hypothetical protein GY777_10670 [Candidatus Brocadiaceae bacterium]|nr:hypothetical protein [Candidatus Brocadiaceae bacterium]
MIPTTSSARHCQTQDPSQQADGYAGHNALALRHNVIQLACWAQSAVNSMLQETPIYLRDEKPVDDLLT